MRTCTPTARSGNRGAAGRLIVHAEVLHDLTERRRIRAELAGARARQEVSAARERIAQDLHDRVIQRLYASGMYLDLTLKVPERAELDARIDRVIDDFDATIAEIRPTIFALGQPVAGLRAQVLQLAADAAAVMGFKPRVRFEGPVEPRSPGRRSPSTCWRWRGRPCPTSPATPRPPRPS